MDQPLLIEHLERALRKLEAADQRVLSGRLGMAGEKQTLQEVADQMGVSRERVRQRQEVTVRKISEAESWPRKMQARLNLLLEERSTPLMAERLGFEDAWFSGFDSPHFLANVIQMFSEKKFHVLMVPRNHVIARISSAEWWRLAPTLGKAFRAKAEAGEWTRRDVHQFFRVHLEKFSAPELVPLLMRHFQNTLQFEGLGEQARLLAFGTTAKAVTSAVLMAAKKPLHYTEIAQQVKQRTGKDLNLRSVANALLKQNALLYDRGTYGLIKHCPLVGWREAGCVRAG